MGDFEPTAEAVRSAEEIRQFLVKNAIDPPQLVPTTTGGIQLEWHRGGLDVELHVEPDGSSWLSYEGPSAAEVAAFALRGTVNSPKLGAQ